MSRCHIHGSLAVCRMDSINFWYVNVIICQSSLATLAYPFLKSVQQGAATSVYCCVNEHAVPGGYHADCAPCEPNSNAKHPEHGVELWKLSESMTGHKW